jgi:preprotein translocase subunit YajC
MKTKRYLELSELYSSIYNDVSESHYKVGDKVLSKSGGMKGEVVKVDSEESGDYYTVKSEDGKTAKYSPDELKKGNGGEPKEKEEKFHTNLDKLVHKTFGKSPEEQKEETDLFDHILEYLVAEGYTDTNESALIIMANMSEDWRESIVEGLGGAKNQGDYDDRERERQRIRDEHLQKYKSGELPFQKKKKADQAQKFLKQHSKKTK